jgi:ankyrin repeat protein
VSDALECFIFLVNGGHRIDDATQSDHHPIHYACACGSFEVLSYILGRLPSEVRCNGLLPLAAQSRSPAILGALLSHGAKHEPPAENPAVIAINNLDTDSLRVLLRAGVRAGTLGLIRAVYHGSAAIVRMLLESGERPDRYDGTTDDSPIAMASFLGNEEILEILLERATVIDPPDDTRRGAGVHWLCECRCPRIARIMIEKGIDVSRVDGDRLVGPERLVDRADDAVAIEILEMLVKRGWNVNQENGKDQSTLLAAYVESMRRPVPVIRWLITHGADLGATAVGGKGTIIQALRAMVCDARLAPDIAAMPDQISDLVAEWEEAHMSGEGGS